MTDFNHNSNDNFLSEEEELLALLLEEEGFDPAPAGQTIPRRNRAIPPPLSFAQQRLWFLDQLEPGNPAYNFPVGVDLSGPLKLASLEQSLAEIIRRHEALRTTFATLDEEPVQVIQPQPGEPPPLRLIDLRSLSSEEKAAQASQLAREEASRPFDLKSGPLWRATLLRLADQEHHLLLTFHHIVFDGWSEEILFKELASLYQSFSAGEPASLPPLPLQYADFAQWQREWLSGEVLAAQLDYWRQQLGGHLPVLHLPTDHPRPAIQTFRGASQTVTLSPRLSEALKALSQQNGGTLFITLLTAFKILLYRYSGQTDLLVGTPIANRNRPEIEGMIGFFVNTLVLRTDLSGDPTCQALLEQVRAVALDAYAHQDLPFEQLVETLQPERNLSHQPLFQVMFGLQSGPNLSPALPELKLAPLEVENGTAQFELSLFVDETKSGLQATWEYNTDLFEPETIRRMIGHWETLLADMAANPGKCLSELRLLTAADTQEILYGWNETGADYPETLCLHQLIEAQTRKTPEAVALVFEEQKLTYGDLNCQANRLAHYLRTLGVGPETLVGLAVERSLEMMVGLLAVLKAGGTYVPLDPAYPQERLAFMLEDARITILLTQSQLLEKLPQIPRLQQICLDQTNPPWETATSQNPSCSITPEHLAYVIYTSGSTGRPKGVQIPHRAVVNFLNSMRREPGLAEQDILLAVTTLSFDIAVLELFLPLSVGATVVIAPREIAMEGPALARHLAESGATVMQATPATWQMLLASGWQNHTDIKIWCGGEALTRSLAEQLLAVSDSVWNLYGPTETTIWSTAGPVEPAEGPVPIGRPIANTQLYILGPQLQPLPVGLAGELYLGGAGLARGYLNRPELTAERFIPDPFSHRPGSRLYRTGDLARYRPDGLVEVLGRADHQVKIRGFRVELEEIEATLNQHPDIQQAVVTTWDFGGSSEDRRLIAYFTTPLPSAPDAAELRAYLAQRLPEYMLPSIFFPLEIFPLTPNAKVDRRALPAPTHQSGSISRSTYVAPRDPLELQLSRIWETILEIQPVGVQDNFFEAGGHSLLAVRLMAQIKKRFDQDIPLAALFQNPTIEHLAKILRQRSASRYQSPLVEIQRRGTQPPFFCIHPADGTVLGYVHLARHLGPQQPFYGLQRIGLSKPASGRVEEMAATYIESIRTIQPQGPYLLGGWSMGGIVAFEMAQQLRQQGQAVPLLALFDSWAPAYNRPSSGEANLSDTELDTELLAEFLADLKGRFAHDSPPVPGNFSEMDQEERLTYIIEQAKLLETVIPEGGLPQLHSLLRIFQANIRAVQQYLPQLYPGKIALFQAQEEVDRQPLADPTFGWGELTSLPVEVYTVPGDHYTLLAEPYVQRLAEQLRLCLNQAINNLPHGEAV